MYTIWPRQLQDFQVSHEKPVNQIWPRQLQDFQVSHEKPVIKYFSLTYGTYSRVQGNYTSADILDSHDIRPMEFNFQSMIKSAVILTSFKLA